LDKHTPLVRSCVLAGEFYWLRGGRERVHDVARVARRPQETAEIDGLAFAAFDILSVNGEPLSSFGDAWDWLKWHEPPRPASFTTKNQSDLAVQFEAWTNAGLEGMVLRSPTSGSYKVKPRHSIDAVVIGFTTRDEGQGEGIHDLLLALMRSDGSYQVVGRVGSGFTDDERRAWLCDLQD
jgi:ATP-dependent DNA ligase